MKYFVATIVLVVGFIAKGQNDPFMSYNMLNPTPYNAGWVGVESTANVTFQLRSQWTGYSTSFDGNGGAPITQMLSGFVPIIGSLSGVGINVINDSYGPVSDIAANIPVSINLPIRQSVLSVGIMPGFVSRTQRFDELRFNDPSDRFNKGTKETQTNFNMGLGVVYSTQDESYLGLSVNNITEPNFSFGLDTAINKMERTYALIAGTRKRFSRNITVAPSLMVRSNISRVTFDVNLMLHYNSKAWFGASYRLSEAVIFMVGYSLLPQNKLKLGYSMDLVVASADAKKVTSQEIFLRYDIPDFVFGGKKKVKTPRFIH